jgi:hypothetical protein
MLGRAGSAAEARAAAVHIPAAAIRTKRRGIVDDHKDHGNRPIGECDYTAGNRAKQATRRQRQSDRSAADIRYGQAEPDLRLRPTAGCLVA